MINFSKIFDSAFGLSQNNQSQTKENISYTTSTEHFYLNNKEVSKEEFYGSKPVAVNKVKSNSLTKNQFITMMMVTKNTICL
jgi:hypothetical protein